MGKRSMRNLPGRGLQVKGLQVKRLQVKGVQSEGVQGKGLEHGCGLARGGGHSSTQNVHSKQGDQR